VDPLALVNELDRANERLSTSVARLPGDLAAAQPSLLPHWTRGHLLTHLARHADAMVNLLTGVRTGVPTPGYASPQAREDAIRAGAGRPLAEQLADLRAATDRLAATCRDTTAEEWTRQLAPPDGPQVAARIPWRRLREVEVHHVDLLVGYEPGDWSESFAHRLLHEVAAGLGGVDLTLNVAGIGHPVLIGAGGPELSGTAAQLAAWLTGRSDGYDLGLPPDGALPDLPDWM
jgi:maleylpyruvate isomerase